MNTFKGSPLTLPLTFETHQLSEGFSSIVYDAHGMAIDTHLSEAQAETIVTAVNAYDKQRALIETLVKMLQALEGCVIDSITSSKAEVELYQHGPQSRLTRSQGELKELRTLHSNLTAALAAAKEITQ